uniref:Uncharacterized protein n=1 Tax=Quercus lobata TaxID=97700 RepID=A0A7N2LRF5_QUELO
MALLPMEICPLTLTLTLTLTPPRSLARRRRRRRRKQKKNSKASQAPSSDADDDDSSTGFMCVENGVFLCDVVEGKRGVEKQPFQLPDFIAATGIEKIT